MVCDFGKCKVTTIFLLCITTASVSILTMWSFSGQSVIVRKHRLCACHRCLAEFNSTLKEQLINSSPPPLMSKMCKTSPKDINWWLHLQRGLRDENIFNQTVESLFRIISPIPDVVKQNPSRCRTCAVVGNSGNLLGSNYGPIIDYHNIIIRMNRGRTKGYESDVGTRTTHHVMYPESAITLKNTTKLVFFSFKINDLQWLLKKLNSTNDKAGRLKSMFKKDQVMIINPAFMKYVHEVWLQKMGRYPSTGFMTLALSFHICDEVNLFGFGADRDGNWNHYFEKMKNKKFKTGPHPGKNEYSFIENLRDNKMIKFFSV